MIPLRLLVLDIETAPSTVLTWSLFDQRRIPDEMMREPGYTLCVSVKWLGGEYGGVIFRTIRKRADGPVDKAALRWIHKLISEADGIITYNGDSFDLPTLNREFVEAGMTPANPTASIDLYKVVKRKFRFASNKMGYVAKRLRIANKAPSPGMACWIGCMAGDAKAWAKMRRYNVIDVDVTAAIYKRCLPWIDSHPNAALQWKGRGDPLMEDRPICRNCGSNRVRSTGHFRRTGTALYRAYKCYACGKPVQGRKNCMDKDAMKKVGR